MGNGEWQSPFRAGVGNGEWGVAEPHGCNPRPDPLLPTHHSLFPLLFSVFFFLFFPAPPYALLQHRQHPLHIPRQ